MSIQSCEVGHHTSPKKPPRKVIKSIQYDLFSAFLANDQNDVSNAVEYWERIPKYFFSAHTQQKLRTADGLAKPYKYHYTLRNKHGVMLPYQVEIQPALIEQADGEYKAFFPTKTEENIEEVLKKIFTQQNFGIHDTQNLESWVSFSYNMVRRELYRMGCGLRYDQIKQSLEVMSKCVLSVYEDGRELYTGAILQDYTSINRKDYIEDTQSMHVARLPIFISHAVNKLQYRQYNYSRFMACKEQLTRWLYKRLINRFTNANLTNDYHFMYSDVKQASGLLQQKEEHNNRKKVIAALTELQDRAIITGFKAEENKAGRKISDVKYTVIPTLDFVREQKAANKRITVQETKTGRPTFPIGVNFPLSGHRT